MTMNIGQAQQEPVTGLAGRIWSEWLSRMSGAPSFQTDTPIVEQKRMRALCEAIAIAVVGELQANAKIAETGTKHLFDTSTLVIR